jgi:hypothetical protein
MRDRKWKNAFIIFAAGVIGIPFVGVIGVVLW